MSRRKRLGESSGDRVLAVLGLFTSKPCQWTVEGAARDIGISAPTAYRYFRILARRGLIATTSAGRYTLGPAIIELDRQIRLSDPLLNAARPIMLDLVQYASDGSIILLCRRFGDRVICIHQVAGKGPQEPVSYERGRPMPLYRGATSKIILAYLPTPLLRKLYARDRSQIAAAKLGLTWGTFKDALTEIRRASVCITKGEVDPQRTGIAAPLFDQKRCILGSLTFVLLGSREDKSLTQRLAVLTCAGAAEIQARMFGLSTATRQR